MGVHSYANGEGLQHEIKDAVATIASRFKENLRALDTHIGNAESAQRETLDYLDRILGRWDDRMQDQMQSLEHKLDGAGQQLQALQQEIVGVQEFVRNLSDRVASAQQQCDMQQQQYDAQQQLCDELQRRCDAQQRRCDELQAQLRDADDRSGETVRQVASLSGSLDEEARRRSKIEVSVGTMGIETEKITGIETRLARVGEDVEGLHAALTRRGTIRKVAAGIAVLIAVSAVVMHFTGALPAFTSYVAPWVVGKL